MHATTQQPQISFFTCFLYPKSIKVFPPTLFLYMYNLKTANDDLHNPPGVLE